MPRRERKTVEIPSTRNAERVICPHCYFRHETSWAWQNDGLMRACFKCAKPYYWHKYAGGKFTATKEKEAHGTVSATERAGTA